MIRRATTSVGLSFLIAGGAAISLHRPRLPSSPIMARSGLLDPPPTSPGAARDEAFPPSPTPAIAWDDPPRPAGNPVREAKQPVSPPMPPRGDSTRVEVGESLIDVASRVYGEDADLAQFWKFNRDQLSTPQTPLRPGMRLRTPAL